MKNIKKRREGGGTKEGEGEGEEGEGGGRKGMDMLEMREGIIEEMIGGMILKEEMTGETIEEMIDGMTEGEIEEMIGEMIKGKIGEMIDGKIEEMGEGMTERMIHGMGLLGMGLLGMGLLQETKRDEEVVHHLLDLHRETSNKIKSKFILN
jgi:hypothetical protein